MIDIDRVKGLYLKGYEAPEISKKIGATVEATRKWIQRNLGDLKREHIIAVTQRKEAIKAVNYEAKKYISDRSFILKNRSAYKTKENGDIVINKDVVPVVTWDMPRGLVNEFKNCM